MMLNKKMMYQKQVSYLVHLQTLTDDDVRDAKTYKINLPELLT